MLTVADLAALTAACAPTVAPSTMLALAKVESAMDPYAIGVNRPVRRTLHPRTLLEAQRQAKALQDAGADFDLGLTQVNARNLARLGLSAADAFDPCRNLRGGARILTENYLAAARPAGRGPVALRIALSAYNTGDPTRGLRNGYVARVYRAAAQIVPAIASAAPPTDPEGLVRLSPAAAAQATQTTRPSLDPFVAPDRELLVWPRPGPATPPPANPSRLDGAF